jgi:5-formyltetrahydrofolate cyclo-ligase
MSTKEDLRKIFQQKRRNLSAQEVAEKSQKINQNFLENLLPKIYNKNSSQVFALYLSSSNEVSCDLVKNYFLQNEIKFCYPKIVQKNFPLDFILHQANQTLVANQFYPKILEPDFGEKKIPDFLILPLVAFDKHLSRLGMGGGFFDRTIEMLKTQKNKIITIGFGFDFQMVDEPLPSEKTDQRLDFIATESFCFATNSAVS